MMISTVRNRSRAPPPPACHVRRWRGLVEKHGAAGGGRTGGEQGGPENLHALVTYRGARDGGGVVPAAAGDSWGDANGAPAHKGCRWAEHAPIPSPDASPIRRRTAQSSDGRP